MKKLTLAGALALAATGARAAERDKARDENARLRAVVEQIRHALHDAGSAEGKVRGLIDRLKV